LAKVAKLAIMIKEEMLIRKKSITKYRQDFDDEESKDYDEKEKWKPKKKKAKVHSKTIRRCVYYQNCYNEGQLTKECQLLNKFC
jgi:hypothetical protein